MSVATSLLAAIRRSGVIFSQWELVVLAACCLPAGAFAQQIPNGREIDARVGSIMQRTQAKGMAVAVVDRGRVKYVQAYGVRNAQGDPLQTNTVMYAASITKAVFAYNVMQLVDQGKLSLDTPIKDDLEKPLPEYDTTPQFRDFYGGFADLANDPRWQKITPRMCLQHSTGFANFWFAEPDQKLKIHFEPGTQYSYSGEGLLLLQFAIEHGSTGKGLGIDLGAMMKANFDRLGMTRTYMTWRNGQDANVADGWNDKGEPQPHSKRSKIRVAGSMNTTIEDIPKFAAALVAGNGLSPAAHAEMLRPAFHITTAHQFPNFGPDAPAARQRKDLNAGLGVILFDGPQGPGFYKGGHDDQTANTMVCIDRSQRCVVILSNDVRSEAGFAELVRFILGDTGVPYEWEYGDYAGKS
ncbi:serine hydrolase domain-containing protein [Silvibacterium acidisoli]|uniref:serine hydrolase domain-containing protein n=1 Tax=Acidobacteriaceae bacterium ZG23-2 TaxID=2883246 RepID=UPI00406D4FE7